MGPVSAHWSGDCEKESGSLGWGWCPHTAIVTVRFGTLEGIDFSCQTSRGRAFWGRMKPW